MGLHYTLLIAYLSPMYSVHDTAECIYQSRNVTVTSFLCLGPGLWSRPHSLGGGRLLFSAMRSFHVGAGVRIWMDGWK